MTAHAANEPTPKRIRAAIPAALRTASLGHALVVTVLAAALYAGGLALFVLGSGWLRGAAVPVAALGLAALFVIGHEAQHQHFTGHKRLDWWIAYVVLLQTWHAMRAVTYAHVKLHHRYTNIIGRDPQWQPLSKATYDALSAPRRALEHLYRSWWGLGLYWTLEMALHLGLNPWGPLRRFVRSRDHAIDRAVVVVFIAANVALFTWLGPQIGVAWYVAVGFYVGSVLAAHWLLGFVTYFQHTGPNVRWYATPEQWSFYGAQIAGTQDFFLGIRHNAHHVDMTIPAHHLGEAQRSLEHAFPRTPVLRVRDMPAIVRACKLYDCDRQAWTDFDGTITARSIAY